MLNYLLLLCCCRKVSANGGVTLEGLTLSTPHGEQLVCQGLSLSLAPGQSLLVVGASGMGKTSLMRAVAGGSGGGASWDVTPATCVWVDAQWVLSSFLSPQR